MPADVSLIIPSYGSFDALAPCLESVRTADPELELDIIVVDDAWSDPIGKDVETHAPDVRYIRRKVNGGFAAAVNTGVREADPETRYIAVLNSDTTVESQWLTRLCAVLDDDDSIASVAPLIVQAADPLRLDSAGLCYTVSGWAYRRGFGEPVNELWRSAVDILGPTGCAAVYRRSALADHRELFDECLGSYYEDTLIALMLRRCGHRSRLVPDAVVRHVIGASFQGQSKRKARLVSRNVELVFWRMMPLKRLSLGVFHHLLFDCTQLIMSMRSGTAVAFLHGKLQALVRLPQVFTDRRGRTPGRAGELDRWIERSWLAEARRQRHTSRDR